MDAEKEGIVVPLTLEDYCIKTQVKSTTQEAQVTLFSQSSFGRRTLLDIGLP